MDAAKILEHLKNDSSLFNARYHKWAEAAANHIATQTGEKVTKEEVAAVMETMAIHPGTGAVLPEPLMK